MYCILCSIIFMLCYLDLFVKNIDRTVQLLLINFFNFCSWIVIIIGAIDTFPKDPHSNKRVWFYFAIMGGLVAAMDSLTELINKLIHLY